MTPASPPPATPEPGSAITEPGSFRDREGRVFYAEDQVYRALSEQALDQWSAVSRAPFFVRAMSAGQVIQTERAGSELLPDDSAEAQNWAAVLRHQRVPFVSYPYEWSFSMLRDAALLQLELLGAAVEEDFVLKDASSYNVQWLGHHPTFIDVASFERLPAGDPWIGYLQFCQLFLYPLLLTSYKDVPFQPLLRGSLDGIDPDVINAVFSKRDLLRRGALTHVYLQSRLKRSWADRDDSVRQKVRNTGFSKQLILNNVLGLKKLIKGLEWRRTRSEWSDYGTDHSYSESDHRMKEEFVRNAARAANGPLLWDLGCNNGRFTRIAAEHFEYAVAMDADHLAIDRLYLSLGESIDGNGRSNILPLVNNLVDPSPCLGWRGKERKSLEQRGTPDLTLALALIHHVVIGANVPLAEFVDWLASLGGALVIEFVGKNDSMVKKLLLNKSDNYDDYNQAFLEQCLDRYYKVEDRLAVKSGTRVLYFCTSK